MATIQQALNAVRATVLAQAGVKCPYCGGQAKLVGGKAIYPHRADLHARKFWQCAPCDAYVGCHKPNPQLGFDGTQPLGRLANAELRKAKSAAHESFDPIWQEEHMSRRAAYAWLAKALGIPVERCHIGEFDVALCRRVESLSEAYFDEVLLAECEGWL